MKISESWLRSWVNPSAKTDELVSLLTFAGLEVDSVAKPANDFDNVVVGKITSVEQHPDADKLRVCAVSDGNEIHQVVCGAANAREGIVVPFAKVGAQLGPDFKIKKAKLRGVESFGMLCGADELGLSETRDGLMELPSDAPVGADLREYLDLDDAIIEIDLTPNRGDCFGLRGIAREVGVLTRTDVNEPSVPAVASAIDAQVAVELIDSEGCPRYLSRVISGVDLSVPSPEWLVERLRRAGVRSIDPAVDVTNYVMLELGQPMHAFDRAQIDGGIRVRRAESGEKLTLLDGKEITLDSDVLVIADHAKPLALAGIMGGEHSGVASSTQDLLLEVAWFNPLTIAGRARRFGLHTDASQRYERGVDSELQAKAIERATQLLLDIVGGQPGPVVVAEADLPAERVVQLRHSALTQQLGFEFEADLVTDILARLGLSPVLKDGVWSARAPSWRHDISIEQDLVEEVARVYGYDKLPSKLPAASQGMPKIEERIRDKNRIRNLLVDQGLNEVITYSFVGEALHNHFHDTQSVMDLANPITSDMVRMRQSMLPGLCATAAYNLNRQQNSVCVFEMGQCFVQVDGQLTQNDRLGILMAGQTGQGDWLDAERPIDFFDLKGAVEGLLAEIKAPVRFVAAERAGLHPGQTAQVWVGDKLAGYIGAVHPSVCDVLDLPESCMVADLSFASVSETQDTQFTSLTKFPSSSRDFALLVKGQPWSAIETCIVESAGGFLRGVELFDIYRSDALGEDVASLAVRLTWRNADATLSEDEVQASVDAVLSSLREQLDVTLR